VCSQVTERKTSRGENSRGDRVSSGLTAWRKATDWQLEQRPGGELAEPAKRVRSFQAKEVNDKRARDVTSISGWLSGETPEEGNLGRGLRVK